MPYASEGRYRHSENVKNPYDAPDNKFATKPLVGQLV